jgi:uncharacterized cupin superfamily protein
MSDIPHLQRIEIDTLKGAALDDWPAMDSSGLVSGEPVQCGRLYDEHEETDYSVGIWECTAFDDQPGPYPVDEFMFLLEGHVEMVMPDGSAVMVNAGEAFVIPKGLNCQWKMPDTVRKIFMILDGAAPGMSDNASLRRVTVPPLTASSTQPDGAVSTRTTHFLNHDNNMSVYTDAFAEDLSARAPSTGRYLVYVLEGEVSFSTEPDGIFGDKNSFYLMPDHDLSWNIKAGTRLLVSECHLP